MESTSYKTVSKTDPASMTQTDNNLIKPVICSQTYEEAPGWWWVLADRAKRERSQIRKKNNETNALRIGKVDLLHSKR